MDAATITVLCTGIVSIITAIFAGLTSLRNGRKIDTVQGTVNGTLTASTVRNEQLTATLTDAGVPVPPHPVVIIEHDPA